MKNRRLIFHGTIRGALTVSSDSIFFSNETYLFYAKKLCYLGTTESALDRYYLVQIEMTVVAH